MAHEGIILYGYTLADEGVTLNLAVFANFGTFLYLHEWPDFCVVTNLATVQIYEILNADVPTKFHICGDLFHF